MNKITHLMQWLFAAKAGEADQMLMYVVIIGIVAIILAILVSAYLGLRAKAKREARIAERRRQRMLRKKMELERQKQVMENYAKAKERVEALADTRQDIIDTAPTDKKETPETSAPAVVTAEGPKYVKVDAPIGVSAGSGPLRVKDEELEKVVEEVPKAEVRQITEEVPESHEKEEARPAEALHEDGDISDMLEALEEKPEAPEERAEPVEEKKEEKGPEEPEPEGEKAEERKEKDLDDLMAALKELE